MHPLRNHSAVQEYQIHRSNISCSVSNFSNCRSTSSFQPFKLPELLCLGLGVTPVSTFIIYSVMSSNSLTNKKGVFPKLAMVAVACGSFMDSFCLQIIVPNLPFAVQTWFPDVAIEARFDCRSMIQKSVTTMATSFQVIL